MPVISVSLTVWAADGWHWKALLVASAHNLYDLEGEPLVVPGLLEVPEVSANAGGVHGGDAQSGMALLQPPREKAQALIDIR